MLFFWISSAAIVLAVISVLPAKTVSVVVLYAGLYPYCTVVHIT